MIGLPAVERAIVVVSVTLVMSSAGTRRPVIGVLAQGIKDSNVLKYFSEARGKSYIAASYVKFIESAGGRVVPITDQSSDSELEEVFKSINGLLLPGGASNLFNSPFAKTGQSLLQRAISENDNGVYFPILSICLGFEFLVNTIANRDLLSQIACEGPHTLRFTDSWKSSKIAEGLDQRLVHILSTDTKAYYHNKYSFKPAVFDEDNNLKEFFNVIALSDSDNKEVFVAAAEAKKYPFYGFQWHPEKAQFEWTTRQEIDHSPAAIEIGQNIANFFLNESRKNTHHFESERKENEGLIWNYQPLYTGDISDFEQIYIL